MYALSEGGTISNLYSILLARYHFYPDVKTRGMGALPQLALFTSEHVKIPHSIITVTTLTSMQGPTVFAWI